MALGRRTPVDDAACRAISDVVGSLRSKLGEHASPCVATEREVGYYYAGAAVNWVHVPDIGVGDQLSKQPSLALDPANSWMLLDGHPIKLSPGEFSLLRLLSQHAGKRLLPETNMGRRLGPYSSDGPCCGPPDTGYNPKFALEVGGPIGLYRQ